jgi:hypothetical protein
VRTRDFRLTRERAAELRCPAAINWLSRVIGGGEGAPRLVPLQRLAAAAVAIGLVMAVVTSPAGIPGFSTGSAALKTVGQASEAAAVGSAPSLAVAPNAAAPASASGAASAAGLAGAPPATISVQPPPAASSAAAPIVGVAQAPTAGRPAASPVVAPSSAAQLPSPAAVLSAGRASGSSVISAQSSPLTALAPRPRSRSGASGQPEAQDHLGATNEPFGPWQAWLVLAAAGLLSLIVVRLWLRRPT